MAADNLLATRRHLEHELDCAEQVRQQWPALYRATSPDLRIELAHINAALARQIPEVSDATHPR